MLPGFVTGMIAVIIIIVLIRVLKRDAYKNNHYDERQLILRANGYKAGFLVTVIGILILILWIEGAEDYGFRSWIEPGFGMFAVLMIGIITFTVYCIVKEAFFAIGQKGNAYIVLCLVVSVLNAIPAAIRIVNGTIWDNGKISFESGSNLICAVSFLIIVVALLAKKIQTGKEAE